MQTYFFSTFVNSTRANHDLIYPSISAPNWLVEHKILGAGGFEMEQKFLCPPPVPSQRRTKVLGGRGWERDTAHLSQSSAHFACWAWAEVSGIEEAQRESA